MKSASANFPGIILFVLLLNPVILSSQSLKVSEAQTIQGIWLGELEIPNQAKLRMGVIISVNTDNTYKAYLNIIDQATGNIPCDDVIYQNDTVVFHLRALGIEIAGSMDNTGEKINSEFKQAGAIFPVLFTRVERLPELLRPQEPKGPFPYTQEEVVFENKPAGIKLTGTLTIPEATGTYPAVVLISGSGQQDRNEEIGRHKPFWIIADYLTRNGIAVLRYDDRGIGGSTGNFDQSTTGDFAADALAGISYLQTRTEIRPEQIGIIGHSEGGIAASVAASESPNVAFIVGLAGFVNNFEDVVLEQLLDQSKQQGKNESDIELERNWRKSIYGIAKEKTDSATAAKKLWELFNGLSVDEINRLNWPKGRHESQIKQILNPWWRYSLSLDNQATLMNVTCPILALYGELDKQVNPDENIPFVEASLKKGGNKHYEVKKLPGLNHLFQTATTGSEYEYFRIEETISPRVLQLISGWITNITEAK